MTTMKDLASRLRVALAKHLESKPIAPTALVEVVDRTSPTRVGILEVTRGFVTTGDRLKVSSISNRSAGVFAMVAINGDSRVATVRVKNGSLNKHQLLLAESVTPLPNKHAAR